MHIVVLDEIKQEMVATIDGKLRRTLFSRIRLIANYVAFTEGKCDGKRHTLMLIWYSSLVPLVGTSNARVWLHRLNALFVDASGVAHPLTPMEIQGIMRSVHKAGTYKFKNTTICTCLNLSKKQYAEMAYSPKERNKRAKKKQQTQYAKKQRNQMITDAVKQGHTNKEIAAIANCSLSTVKRVKKEMRDYCDGFQT